MIPDFLDTHLHSWHPQRIHYGWLEEAPAVLNQVREPDQIVEEAKASGMQQAILVQAANAIAETEYLLALADTYDWIVGVVGWVDLVHPAAVAEQLQTLTKNPYLKGIRHLIHGEADEGWLLQASVLESLALLAEHNLPYDVVGTTLRHLDCAISVAQRLPRLQLVLDHLNQPPVNVDKATEWKSRMQLAASLPNLSAKISGLGTVAQKGADWHQADMYPWIAFAVETFGADRLMLGSDWPVCLLAGTYHQAIEQYKAIIPQLVSEAEVEKIFTRNARRIYRL